MRFQRGDAQEVSELIAKTLLGKERGEQSFQYICFAGMARQRRWANDHRNFGT